MAINSNNPTGNVSQTLADNLAKAESSLKASSSYTEKMSSEIKTMSKLSTMFGRDTFLGTAVNAILPKSNIQAGINRLVEVYSQGMPNIESLKKSAIALQKEMIRHEADFTTSLGAANKERKKGLDIAEKLHNIYARSRNEEEITNGVMALRSKLNRESQRAAFDLLDASIAQEKSLQIQSGELREQAEIYQRIRGLHVFEEMVRTALVGTGFVKAVGMAGQFNKSLIETSAALSNRYSILGTALKTQMAVGSSLEENTKMLASLSIQGFKTEEEFNKLLTTSLKMVDSLGLSSDSIAELARNAVMLKQPFNDIADAMASVVENTRLTAAEAKSIVSSISQSYMIIGGADSNVIKSLAKYEDIIKSKTGKTGELTTMVGQMASTIQGMSNARMLGISPEELKTNQGVETLLRRLSQRIEADTVGKNPMAKVQSLENISQLMTGGAVSPATLSQLATAYREVNGQMDKRYNIEQRWRDQMANTMEAVNRLKGSFQSLLLIGFSPILSVVSRATSMLAGFVGVISKIPGVALAVSTVVSGVFVYSVYKAVKSIGLLILAIRELGNSALLNAAKTQTAGKLQTVSPIFGQLSEQLSAVGKKWSGLMTTVGSSRIGQTLGRTASRIAPRVVPKITFLGRGIAAVFRGFVPTLMKVFTFLISPAGLAVVASALTGALVGYGIYKLGEMVYNAISKDKKSTVNFEQRKLSGDKFNRDLREKILGGDMAEARNYILKNRDLLEKSGRLLSQESYNFRLEAARNSGKLPSDRHIMSREVYNEAVVARIIGNAIMEMRQRKMIRGVETQDDAVAKKIGESIEANRDLIKNSDLQIRLMQEQIKLEKSRQQQEDDARDAAWEVDQYRYRSF